jgi:hypothetical protein
MSAIASTNLSTNQGTAVAAGYAAELEEVSMRERLIAVRDTMVVLALQIVFRAGMMLRRFNY